MALEISGQAYRRIVRMSAMPLAVAVTIFALLELSDAWAGSPPGRYVAPSKQGINKDAMTMQECRDRLAVPANERPPSDDPRVNKDAVCTSMLSADKALLGSQKAKAASAPAVRKSRPQASSQPRS
jgi:hypothetical protein